MRRGDWFLLIAAAAASALFFARVGALWPLAGMDLLRKAGELRPAVDLAAARAGVDLDGRVLGSRLRIDEPAVDHIARVHGRDTSQALIAGGSSLLYYKLTAKRGGEADALTVHASAAAAEAPPILLGWELGMQEDAAGARLTVEAALALVRAAARADLAVDLDAAVWSERERASQERPARRDHRFTWERRLASSAAPAADDDALALRERIEATVAGERVVKLQRILVAPAAAARLARARKAPGEAMEALGFFGVSVFAVIAAVILLRRLRSGHARLLPAAGVTALALALLAVHELLQQAVLVELWDPLWPRALSLAKHVLNALVQAMVPVVCLFIFIVAGDALDRSAGSGRGAALWSCLAGRWTAPGVVAGSLRGFLIGCLCGGVLAGTVALIHLVAPDAHTALQPRGFFLQPLNSLAPVVTTLCFFTQVALLEECGYRFFAGTWLEQATGRRWIAILAPAALYGLTHSAFGFLPPADPFWARPLALMAVGCVWGWAFLRYDALTVVLSHLTADLFIFTWPRLGSGDPAAVASALATIAVPLLPAAVGLALGAWRRAGSAGGTVSGPGQGRGGINGAPPSQ